MPPGRPIKHMIMTCNQCLETKERSLFENKYSCKDCYKPRKPILDVIECTKCKTTKPRSSFYKTRRVCSDCFSPTILSAARKHKYGVDDSIVQVYWEKQGGKCKNPGCDVVFENTADGCVDHNHETGAVRGLLCHGCNAGLGLLRENPNVILGLIEYLKDPGTIHNARKRRLTPEEKLYIADNPDNKTRDQLAEQFEKTTATITNVRSEVKMNRIKAQQLQLTPPEEACRP